MIPFICFLSFSYFSHSYQSSLGQPIFSLVWFSDDKGFHLLALVNFYIVHLTISVLVSGEWELGRVYTLAGKREVRFYGGDRYISNKGPILYSRWLDVGIYGERYRWRMYISECSNANKATRLRVI